MQLLSILEFRDDLFEDIEKLRDLVIRSNRDAEAVACGAEGGFGFGAVKFHVTDENLLVLEEFVDLSVLS